MAGADRVTEWQQSIITGIQDPDDHPNGPPLIAQLYEPCSVLFRDIIAAISGDSSIEKSVLLSLQRSQSYLVLWADGYGVNDGMLDKSLDKSRRARATTFRLLFSVSQTLTTRLVLLLPKEHQARLSTKITHITLAADKIKIIIEHDDTEDSDSDTSSDSSSQVGDPDLDEIAEDLLTDTQCLMDLGSRFQEDHVGPVNVESAVSAAQFGTWEPSMNFVDRVRWRYPQCETALAERLGKANWARVLRHRETVSENSRSELAESDPIKPAPSQVASTAFRDSAFGSSVHSAVSGNPTTEYAETMMSYRAGQGDSVRVPSLPEGAREGKPFSCVGCGMEVTVKTKSAWKKHLFLDLKPYICLEDGCDFNGSPFPTKAQWKHHILLEHGGPSPSSAITSPCPICQDDSSKSQTHITVHLARHLEEIALTVLPTNIDSEDGTDLDSGLASSETSQSSQVSARRKPECFVSDQLEDDEETMRFMGRRKRSTSSPSEHTPKKCKDPDCNKVFTRPDSLRKHEQRHTRPFTCPIRTCKYNKCGWGTQKELDRHVSDKHSAPPKMFECQFKPCPYKSKRESNCKQHMEKAHGWTYIRTKTRHGKPGSTAESRSVATVSNLPPFPDAGEK